MAFDLSRTSDENVRKHAAALTDNCTSQTKYAARHCKKQTYLGLCNKGRKPARDVITIIRFTFH
jgi:hypothetical protein